jgi:hypothetical protein
VMLRSLPPRGTFRRPAPALVPQSWVGFLERPVFERHRSEWNDERLQRLNRSVKRACWRGVVARWRDIHEHFSARLGGLFLAADAGQANSLASEWRSLGGASGAVFLLALD